MTRRARNSVERSMGSLFLRVPLYKYSENRHDDDFIFY